MISSHFRVAKSEEAFSRARTLLPGGVNSPVRAFNAVGGTPPYFERASGAWLYDIDGNEFIDYVSSWGAIIHGHAYAPIHEAIVNASLSGTSFGAPHLGEIWLAEEVISRMPGLEMVRFVNSGTEAALAAIRLARAATGRTRILKFEGNYHGAVDALLAKAGSGVATFGLPDSAGVPAEITHSTLLARYNDLDQVRQIVSTKPSDIAAILVEPVAGNMGLVPPSGGFLDGLRAICSEYGVVLVFDEVMTGFRLARGGATERFGVVPDLTIMGKVIGGGLPVGAYGGRRELLNWVAPVGPMYQAGTLSGNPLAMAAGFAALSSLTASVYDSLELVGAQLEAGLRNVGLELGVPMQVQRVGSMISVFFTETPVRNYDDAQKTDRALFGRLFHGLLRRGVYLPPSALEAWFLNASHSLADVDTTVSAFREALSEAV